MWKPNALRLSYDLVVMPASSAVVMLHVVVFISSKNQVEIRSN